MSRYDYMSSSTIQDIDRDEFPDPLSLPYNNIQLTNVTKEKTLSSADLSKFWLSVTKEYGTADLDDVLLSINSIPYLGMLMPGNKIYILAPEDLNNFYKQKRPGTEDI